MTVKTRTNRYQLKRIRCVVPIYRRETRGKYKNRKHTTAEKKKKNKMLGVRNGQEKKKYFNEKKTIKEGRKEGRKEMFYLTTHSTGPIN